MGAVAKVESRIRYERTSDLRRMLTSGQLAEAIKKEVKRQFARQEPESNIFSVLPARVATSMNYKAGKTKAQIWNEGGEKVNIYLPLGDGWRESDGNPFGVPNGKESTRDDPEALHLVRHQNRDFSGPVGLGCGRGRGFGASDGWSVVSGVALVSGRPEVRSTLGPSERRNVHGSIETVVSIGASERSSLDEATSPLVEVTAEKLVSVADPQKLREDAAQLRQLAENLQERFKGSEEVLREFVSPMLEKAARFIEVAEAIEQARK